MSATSSVRLGSVRLGMATSGLARLGLVRQGLTTADRELEIVLLRVLWHDESRHGKVRSGGDRQGLM
jgi:hypothetical protein